MQTASHIGLLLLATGLVLLAGPGHAQHVQDSMAAAPAAPPWRDSARYGDGPSVGAPPSDYTMTLRREIRGVATW